MVIIHIASIESSVIGGVQVAVPLMIEAQEKYAKVGLYNINGTSIKGIKMISCNGKFDINKLEEPFNKPDLIVFHEVYRFKYINLYKHIVKTNIPYIIIPHGCLSKTAQHKKALKKLCANILFFNRFIKSADSIQYLSKNEKEMTNFKKHNCFISGNGIRLPQTTKQSFSNDGIKFIYIGRLDIHIKGIDILLKAIKECESTLRRKNSIIKIYGPDYNQSHKIINEMKSKLKIEDIVKLNDAVFGKDKENALLDADCFIQASRSEGLPLGPIEALSYGLPCIVTEGVGLGDSIENFQAGYKSLVDAISLSDAIKKFIDNYDSIQKMSNQAKLLANEFDVESIARNAIDEYSHIIKK